MRADQNVLCVLCPPRDDQPPRLAETGNGCTPCARRVERHLLEIRRLYGTPAPDAGPLHRPDPVNTTVPAGPVPAAAIETAPAGGAKPRTPEPVEQLDLIGPGAAHVTDPFHDQLGDLPPRVLLEEWVIDWRDQAGQRGPSLRDRTVPEYVAWLLARLNWALANHPPLRDFATEMAQLADRLRTAAGEQPPQPEREKYAATPCRKCDTLGVLYHMPGDEYIECGYCGLIYQFDEYDQWAKQVAAFEAARRRSRT